MRPSSDSVKHSEGPTSNNVTRGEEAMLTLLRALFDPDEAGARAAASVMGELRTDPDALLHACGHLVRVTSGSLALASVLTGAPPLELLDGITRSEARDEPMVSMKITRGQP